MISSIVYLSSPSETSTEQLAPVGTVRAFVDTTNGYQLFKVVKAVGADIAANTFCKFKSGSSIDVEVTAAAQVNNGTIAGVAQNLIPDGSYGWVVCSGQCAVIAVGAVQANDAVATHADGKIDDATVTEGTTVGIVPANIGVGAVGAIRLWALM